MDTRRWRIYLAILIRFWHFLSIALVGLIGLMGLAAASGCSSSSPSSAPAQHARLYWCTGNLLCTHAYSHATDTMVWYYFVQPNGLPFYFYGTPVSTGTLRGGSWAGLDNPTQTFATKQVVGTTSPGAPDESVEPDTAVPATSITTSTTTVQAAQQVYDDEEATSGSGSSSVSSSGGSTSGSEDYGDEETMTEEEQAAADAEEESLSEEEAVTEEEASLSEEG